nr:hypothetical protein [Tanacetum cinerariifolium]
MESIHVNFDELPHMVSAHISSDPDPTRQTMASVQTSTDPDPTRQTMASVQNSTDPAPTRQSMASVQNSSDPTPECQTMALEHNSLSPGQPHVENAQIADDEFINIFSTPVQEQGETSSRHVDSS